MFFHLFKYKILDLIRKKEEIFWGLLFPIILGTLFYLGFGNLMNGNDIKFETFKVAVVNEADNKTFTETLNSISDSGDLFTTENVSSEKADEMLNNNDIEGIIYVNTDPHLKINKSNIYTTILVSFMNQYSINSDVIENTAKTNPQSLNNVISELTSDKSFGNTIPLGDSAYDPYIQYFYALLAMACLFASNSGLRSVCGIQANLSDLGVRCESSPVHKMTVVLSYFFASAFMVIIYISILFAYLSLVLKINFGPKTGLILLTCYTGVLIGTSFGFFTGAIIKKASIKTKDAIVSSISLFSSFLSGLMVCQIKDAIEHTAPIINRINPATVITDCLYALNMYSDYSRFVEGIVTMLVITTIFCIGSYFALRRNSYDSI